MAKFLNSRTAGFVLVALFSAVLIFQIVMALGLQIQGAAWGGQLDAQPASVRMGASLIASLVLLFAILVVLEKLGIVRLLQKRIVINGLLWFFAVYLLFNTVANLFSSGGIERVVMTPLALASSLLCMVVARAPFTESK